MDVLGITHRKYIFLDPHDNPPDSLRDLDRFLDPSLHSSHHDCFQLKISISKVSSENGTIKSNATCIVKNKKSAGFKRD